MYKIEKNISFDLLTFKKRVANLYDFIKAYFSL